MPYTEQEVSLIIMLNDEQAYTRRLKRSIEQVVADICKVASVGKWCGDCDDCDSTYTIRSIILENR